MKEPTINVYDVKPDGSCFYRSVYQVLKFHGYLLSVCSYIFKKEIDSEDEFVKEIRKYLSHKIANNKDHGHIQSMFKKLSEDDKDIYNIILEGMPSWFVRNFPKQPRSEQRFREIVAENIAKVTSWASQIDIPIFLRVLRKALKGAVDIQIIYNVPRRGLEMNKTKLYLLNLNENHYNYVVSSNLKQCPPTKIRNPLTRRCVKIDGRVGTRVLKHTERSDTN